ncbi:MAG: glucosamine inositolphosphorylceramide transferase family protein [Gammaproteobacteria bacterium]
MSGSSRPRSLDYDLWSIGIATGASPFALQSSAGLRNPVLAAADVSDAEALYVADPFMLFDGLCWHMFFEVLEADRGLGAIAHALSSGGSAWQYQRIVLREVYHLSYPHVFTWDGDYWMIPETLGAHAVCLYRGAPFPERWTLAAELLPLRVADPTIFHVEGRWWMFACTTPRHHDTLALYWAGELTGPWREHPESPIVIHDAHRARPGGRVLVDREQPVRFAQDCVPSYGREVRAFEILELTPARYREREIAESPILSPDGEGWRGAGMHHIDLHRCGERGWIACVDGRRS